MIVSVGRMKTRLAARAEKQRGTSLTERTPYLETLLLDEEGRKESSRRKRREGTSNHGGD